MENESENFSAEYMPFWFSRSLATPLAGFLVMRGRLLLDVPALVSIPATLADRLDETQDIEDIAVQSG